jgi:uncharacterized repeat protein (TIGR03803 family)
MAVLRAGGVGGSARGHRDGHPQLRNLPARRKPYAPLTGDASGDLYGTTYQGGGANLGVVFRLNKSGETVLHNFAGGSDGANPYAGVKLDSAGNLYGTTYRGGTANAGVVYKVGP